MSIKKKNGWPVLVPEILELIVVWILAAGELQRQLHAVREQVVEVLHAPLNYTNRQFVYKIWTYILIPFFLLNQFFPT